MKNGKKTAAMAMLLCLAMLLCGCHGGDGQGELMESADIEKTVYYSLDEARQYEVVFWAKNDTNKVQTAQYRQAIADFEALYPNIHVEMRLYTDYGEIFKDVKNNISTGTTPNVCITYPDHIATYLTGQDIVAPLDDLMTNELYGLGGSKLKFDGPTREEIVPQFLEECVIGGRHYALPYMRSTEACYVNKTYVEKLGFTLPDQLTWDFVWEVSDAAMQKAEDGTFLVNGKDVLIPCIYKSTDNMMIQMLRQLNAPYSEADGSVLIFNDQTRSILYTVAEQVQLGAFSTFKISSYPGNFLNAGECIFAIDSTAGATWMGTDAPNMDIHNNQVAQFETVVLPVPQFDWNSPRMISQGPSVCVFNREDPQEVLASWLFAQFLLTDSVQIGYSQTEGYLPVTLKAQRTEEYQDYLARRGEDNNEHYYVKIDAAKLLMAHTADTFVTPVFDGSTSLRQAAGQLIEEVAKGVRRSKASGKTLTVDEAYLDTVFRKVSDDNRLDEIQRTGDTENADEEMGPLPGTAVALLCALGGVWLLIGAYALARVIRWKKHP